VAIEIEHIAFNECVAAVRDFDAVPLGVMVEIVMEKVVVNPYRVRVVAAIAARRHLIGVLGVNRLSTSAGEFHIGDLDVYSGGHLDAPLDLVVAIGNAEIRPVETKPLDLHVVADDLEKRSRMRCGEKARSEMARHAPAVVQSSRPARIQAPYERQAAARW
jgi:hypothetical protein